MKIVVGVLTYNVLSGLRLQLSDDTLVSLVSAFPDADIVLVDNGSNDGSREFIREASVEGPSSLYLPFGERQVEVILHTPTIPENTAPGAGRNAVLAAVMDRGADVVVFSDDDMVWKAGAEARLIEVWSHAPDDLALVSGLLEPEYNWNTPRETIACGAEHVLVRDSCPAAAWSFRVAWMREYARSSMNVFIPGFGEDYVFCQQVRRHKLRVGQMDLADHAGWGYSTHGNEANENESRPLDREKWGI